MPAKGQTGWKHTPETIEKIKAAVQKAYDEKRLQHWSYTGSYKPKGFQGNHTEETKQRISEARKGKCLGNSNGFTEGHEPWNKGKPHNVHSPEWRKRVSAANSGENHWNWKGGINSENRIMRNSTKHKEWMHSVFKRDRWTCQECGLHGGSGEIVAHHIIPWSKNRDLRFEVSNGVTLCRSCHCLVHKPRLGTGKTS
jgi:5-methylcytosine-specific restriction endonuclease McrA